MTKAVPLLGSTGPNDRPTFVFADRSRIEDAPTFAPSLEELEHAFGIDERDWMGGDAVCVDEHYGFNFARYLPDLGSRLDPRVERIVIGGALYFIGQTVDTYDELLLVQSTEDARGLVTVGYYCGPRVAIAPEHEGRGCATALIVARAVREGGSPQALFDKSGYCAAGHAASRRAYTRGREMLVAARTQQQLFDAVIDGNLEQATAALDAGARPAVARWNALSILVQRSDHAMLSALIKRANSADLDEPLSAAIRRCDPESLSVLLRSGARMNRVHAEQLVDWWRAGNRNHAFYETALAFPTLWPEGMAAELVREILDTQDQGPLAQRLRLARDAAHCEPLVSGMEPP